MINENRNTLFIEVQDNNHITILQSYFARPIKSNNLSSRSLQPSNNRLKLAAHLANFLSARSLA